MKYFILGFIKELFKNSIIIETWKTKWIIYENIISPETLNDDYLIHIFQVGKEALACLLSWRGRQEYNEDRR